KTGRDLVRISISSDKLSLSDLKIKAEALKDKITTVKNISDVTIYGDSDRYISIKLQDRKIESLGLSKESVYNSFAAISYIYPIGKIEDSSKKHFYVSTNNGNKTAQELMEMKISVGDKLIYLKDIASIEKKYKDSTTLARLNGDKSISLAVKQTEEGNALEVAKDVGKIVQQVNQQDPSVKYYVSDDNSKKIRNRLNTVISNILFGIILLTLLLVVLVNYRMSAIIAIGIPTSFIIASIYMYLFDYSINMISLEGVLIALGIVVDDAIVVGENIQRYIDKGMEVKKAALKGAKEMVEPVTIASLTTIFSFLPALMISGTLGEFVKLIPIAVSALVIASLIESFIFLPIHAAHTLKKDTKSLSWEKLDNLYMKLITKLMHYKKTFITTFIILVPLLTVVGIQTSKFQMFPKFDATNVKISLKANKNTKVEETEEILKNIEQDLLKIKEELYIRDIISTVGYRQDSAGNRENYSYVASITLELYDTVPMNVVEKYITPYLSFYDSTKEEIRKEKSIVTSKKLRKFLQEKNYKKQFNLVDISVVERRAGPVKSDLKIGLISNNDEKILLALNSLKAKLESMDGIKSVLDNAHLGISEIKLSVNSYGESLGVTEQYLGQVLSNMFLTKKKGTALDDRDLLDITIESIDKDKIETLQNFNFPLQNGTYVSLKDIVEFKTVEAFEKITKNKGEKTFYVFANVDPQVLTAGEALDKLENTLNKIRQSGVKISFEGAKKKNQELASDMIAAALLAFTLILISLLYLFNSFKETFAVISVIPFSILGVIIGHKIMGLNMMMPSVIGALGLAGVVINDGIIMMTYLKRAVSIPELLELASRRLRPIILTTVTTLIGLTTLIFFPSGEAVIFQPIAISLGFGLAWGTVLNLLYLPSLYAIFSRKKLHDTDTKY
ncbi:MAG: efflux RND transporter permease subunit, partial [Campylobacterales bacterium]|nr:efflux RND transporter permease subunit [Campylobacterales bacterium]